MSESPVIVALDFPDREAAMNFASKLRPQSCALKIGNELFTAAGPELVRELVARGFRLFLDLKFHDIPNTVAQACRSATRLGVWMMNIHASGGGAMLQAAHSAVAEESQRLGRPRPLLIGVTVLTSLDAPALAEVGVPATPQAQVERLAALCASRGLDGVVCSAQEAMRLRDTHGSAFCLVTPGIRPAGAETQDQKRVMTPEAAIAAGATYLVIGRPITHAADPAGELQRINQSLEDQA
ncbi:MAG: orotidine-5'-phosphate decarboxylase [Betaproteobacteria bacterium]|nr:orotidine-5'-phosphate decarboxylase [Betaproteobacteria bacterium]